MPAATVQAPFKVIVKRSIVTETINQWIMLMTKLNA